MSRGTNTYAGAGTLLQHLHEEALHQQHTLDTWIVAARIGRHRANTPRVSTAWTNPGMRPIGWPPVDHQDERPPALVVLDELEEAATYDLPTQRHRRFLDGAGEPETPNQRTEFTRD